MGRMLPPRLALAEAAFAALFAEIGCDLPDVALSAIAALGQSSLRDRVRALGKSHARYKNRPHTGAAQT
ncbi:MAG: hypothetical protein ACRETY_06185 [Steroidobacteraceae bacterium]